MALATSRRLGCGRDIDEVWAHADSPPDAHEVGCPDCRRARQRLSELTAATRQLKQRDADDPDLRLSSEVLDKITSIARAEVRRGVTIPLRRPAADRAQSDLTVSEQALANVVWHAADQLRGVHLGRCRVAATGPNATGPNATGPNATGPNAAGPNATGPNATGPGRSGPAEPVDVTIAVQVDVSARRSVTEQVAALRDRVLKAVAAEVGVRAVTVDVHVKDLHDA